MANDSSSNRRSVYEAEHKRARRNWAILIAAVVFLTSVAFVAPVAVPYLVERAKVHPDRLWWESLGVVEAHMVSGNEEFAFAEVQRTVSRLDRHGAHDEAGKYYLNLLGRYLYRYEDFVRRVMEHAEMSGHARVFEASPLVFRTSLLLGDTETAEQAVLNFARESGFRENGWECDTFRVWTDSGYFIAVYLAMRGYAPEFLPPPDTFDAASFPRRNWGRAAQRDTEFQVLTTFLSSETGNNAALDNLLSAMDRGDVELPIEHPFSLPAYLKVSPGLDPLLLLALDKHGRYDLADERIEEYLFQLDLLWERVGIMPNDGEWEELVDWGITDLRIRFSIPFFEQLVAERAELFGAEHERSDMARFLLLHILALGDLPERYASLRDELAQRHDMGRWD